MKMLTLLVVLHGYSLDLRDRFEEKTRGATAVEYGLMVALIAAVIAAVVLTLGHTVRDKFSTVNNCVSTNTSCS